MATIAANLQVVNARISRAIADAKRIPGSVNLLAVSKTRGASCINDAWHCGQRAFGENSAQEAVTKMRELENLDIEWHFIGPVQSNKSRLIAENFSWVHSIDRAKIAQRLHDARPAHLPPLNVLIQVNISGESSKNGVAPGTEHALASLIRTLPRLQLRGLMAIPEPTTDTVIQRRRFALLRQLQAGLQSSGGAALDTLSMGMSDDLEAAIAEGATIVRVGTAIFGTRKIMKTGN